MRKLEIGSGFRPRAGYEHAEINPACPDVDYVCGMDDIPAEADTFDEVLSVHSIEHVPIATAKRALAEWYRILKPGGVAVIDTPNIERNVSLYLNGGWERDFASLTPGEQEYCSLDGVPNRTLWLNFKVFSSDAQWDQHFWNADAALLSRLALEAGFQTVNVAQTEPSLIIYARK